MLAVVEVPPGSRTTALFQTNHPDSSPNTTDFREPGLEMPTAEVGKTIRARESYLLWCTMHCYDPQAH